MYKEIHPFYYDSSTAHVKVRTGKNRLTKDYYIPAEPRVLRLDVIRQIIPVAIPDGSVKLHSIQVSDERLEDIIVSEEEATEIKKTLLKQSREKLPSEVSHLTAAIRDLYTLLRARLR